jgi:hypothetical protein
MLAFKQELLRFDQRYWDLTLVEALIDTAFELVYLQTQKRCHASAGVAQW